MGSSRHLPLGQVRLALRLVGECRDLGHDPAAWVPHALAGVARLLGARVIGGGIAPPAGFHLFREAALLCYLGWDGPEQERIAARYMAEEQHLQDPTFQRFLSVRQANITLRPAHLLARAAVRGSEAFALRKSVGIEDFVFSQRVSQTGRATFVLAPQRAYGDPWFSARDVSLVRLFHDELALLLGNVLADRRGDPLADLSPRLRQTLAALLEGDGEKQVAQRLGLSRHTVHEYVAELYRRFDVHTRAELLALCLRRRIYPPVTPERPD